MSSSKSVDHDLSRKKFFRSYFLKSPNRRDGADDQENSTKSESPASKRRQRDRQRKFVMRQQMSAEEKQKVAEYMRNYRTRRKNKCVDVNKVSKFTVLKGLNLVWHKVTG